MEDKITILEEKPAISFRNYLKELTISDPMYIEEGLKNEKIMLVPTKFLKVGRGEIIVKKERLEYDNYDKTRDTLDLTTINFNWGVSKTNLDILKDNKYSTKWELKKVQIGVDTATLSVEVNNDKYIEINTGGDGNIGTLLCYYEKGKLVALTGGLHFENEIYDMERAYEEFKYLFSDVEYLKLDAI